MYKKIWRQKPINNETDTDNSGLKRVFGLKNLVAIGVGTTIGAGLFSVTGIAAGQHAGPAVTLSFLIAALACAFAGLCYAELAGMITSSGSVYAYAYASLGELVAWIIGWDLLLEYTVNAATVAASWSAYLNELLQDFGISIDPRFLYSPGTDITLASGAHVTSFCNFPGIVIVWVVTYLLMLGTKQSSTVNNFFVFLKLAIVAIVTILCIPHINSNHFHPYIPPNTGTFGQFGMSGIMQAAGIIFFAYVGFDIVSTAAQDTKNPQRNIPLGILLTLVISAIIYAFFSFVIVGVVDYHLMGNNASPVAIAMNQIHASWLGTIIKFSIVLGYISVIYGLLMGQSRICISMADDGLIPSFFSRLHPKKHTPWGSHILTASISSLLCAFLPVSVLGEMTSIGTILAFIIVCMGVLVLRYRAPDHERCFRIPGGNWLIPSLGIITCLSVMLSMDMMTWLRLILWLFIGAIVYFFYSFKRSQLHKEHHHK